MTTSMIDIIPATTLRGNYKRCPEAKQEGTNLRWIALALSMFLGNCEMALANPVHDAARSGDVNKISELIDDGVSINALDDKGETPLIIAILESRFSVVDIIIEHGADIRARNRGGFTALHAASYVGNSAIARKLLDKGADVNDQDNKAGVTALSVAAEEGYSGVAQVLIDFGAKLEASERNGYTPLSRALWRGQSDVVKVLQKSGAKCQPIEVLGQATYAQCIADQK